MMPRISGATLQQMISAAGGKSTAIATPVSTPAFTMIQRPVIFATIQPTAHSAANRTIQATTHSGTARRQRRMNQARAIRSGENVYAARSINGGPANASAVTHEISNCQVRPRMASTNGSPKIIQAITHTGITSHISRRLQNLQMRQKAKAVSPEKAPEDSHGKRWHGKHQHRIPGNQRGPVQALNCSSRLSG